MPSCPELVEQADALLARELPWRRRLSLRIHLLICEHCRRYLRQLGWLITAIFHRHGPASDEEVNRVVTGLPDGTPINNDRRNS